MANYVAQLGVNDNRDDTSQVRWFAEFDDTHGDQERTAQGRQGLFGRWLDNLIVRYGPA
jgi:hypothetical protein